MEPDAWIVLAPYVAERRLKGRAVFIRLDPSRTQHAAVVATEAVRDVLRQFQAGAVVADVERTVPPAVRGEWSTAVDELSAEGFLLGADSLGAPRPSLELEITNRCNADCLMCPRRELRPLGSMTEATFQAVEALSATAGGTILSGIGEPTLHPRLVEWCGRLHAALPAGAPLAIVTNGARMTADLFDALAEAGVSLVQFSLHSLDVDRSNGIMGWSRHDTAVRNLAECARRRPDLVSVNMVLLDSNAGEIEAMHRFVAGLGLPESRLGLIPVFSRAGTVDPEVVSIRPAPPAAGHCLYLRKSLFVAWNGDLLPCSNDIRGRFSWGNVAGEDPGRIVTRWWRELVLAPPRFDMCSACDHHSRGTLPTAWFEAVGR